MVAPRFQKLGILVTSETWRCEAPQRGAVVGRRGSLGSDTPKETTGKPKCAFLSRLCLLLAHRGRQTQAPDLMSDFLGQATQARSKRPLVTLSGSRWVQSGHPPLAGIAAIRRIGCLADQCLGARRRSRSLRAWCRYPSTPCVVKSGKMTCNFWRSRRSPERHPNIFR